MPVVTPYLPAQSHEVSYFYLILRPGSFKVLREGIVEAVTALVSTVEEMPSTDISRPLASTSQVLIDKMTLRYDCSHHVVHIGVHHHQHQHILCKALGRTFNILQLLAKALQLSKARHDILISGCNERLRGDPRHHRRPVRSYNHLPDREAEQGGMRQSSNSLKTNTKNLPIVQL